MSERRRVSIRHESDVAMARKAARELAGLAGLDERATEALTTAVSELARNVLVHGQGGEIALEIAEEESRAGVAVVARDGGPGIADLERALQDGYSSGGGLGLGLSSARRLADDFAIQSTVGEGTTVTLKKWTAKGRES